MSTSYGPSIVPFARVTCADDDIGVCRSASQFALRDTGVQLDFAAKEPPPRSCLSVCNTQGEPNENDSDAVCNESGGSGRDRPSSDNAGLRAVARRLEPQQ